MVKISFSDRFSVWHIKEPNSGVVLLPVNLSNAFEINNYAAMDLMKSMSCDIMNLLTKMRKSMAFDRINGTLS